jgi:acylglycerol lipase
MKHQEGHFKGLQNLELYYQGWLPDGDPTAVLFVVHGLAEHSGRYGNVVDYFVPRGYAIYALDHRGHGRSEGARVYVERFTDYLDDLKTFFDMVRGWHPDRKIFMVGHSMGGTIGLAYAARYQDESS